MREKIVFIVILTTLFLTYVNNKALAETTYNMTQQAHRPSGGYDNVQVKESTTSKTLNSDNGHYYERGTSAMSWKDAKSFCESRGGFLATINSAAENSFVYGNFCENNLCWLGATDEESEGTWKWATGEVFGYTNWYSGEPNNSGNTEDYITIGNTNSCNFGSKWNDASLNGGGNCINILPVCEYIDYNSTTGKVLNNDNGHYYERSTSAMSWKEGKSFCESREGFLATISSEAENSFVYSNLCKDHLCWLGATDEESEGVWKWVTSESFGYTNWSSGEPNNSSYTGKPENYLTIGSTGTCAYTTMWNDVSLHGDGNCINVLPVCEYVSATPTPTPSPTPTPTLVPTPSPTLTPTPAPTSNSTNKAIVVAGGGPFDGNNLWESTKMLANKAYNTLLLQGFTKDTIYYLSSDVSNSSVDAKATNDNLKAAVTSWAVDANSVVIYMQDHGGFGTFKMNETEVLHASSFRSWLDTLQDNIPGILVVVYDACQSGSFLSYLVPPEGKQRILIASSTYDQKAWFQSGGLISFSNYFLDQVQSGANIYDSFKNAKSATTMLAKNTQEPQIDDNGNGIGNEKSDGDTASKHHIGDGIVSASDKPTIISISDAQTLDGTTTSATIQVQVTQGLSTLKRVWAVITPPDLENGSASQPVTDMPAIELSYANDKYQTTYDSFTVAGTYEIAVYAIDNEDNLSLPVTTEVTQLKTTSQNPLPVITANESDSPGSLSVTDTLRVDVSLDPGGKVGVNADWSLFVYTPSLGTYYYDLSIGWTKGYAVTYRGPLTNLPLTSVISDYPVSTLPDGDYIFYFKIDATSGGNEGGGVYTDSVVVNVKP